MALVARILGVSFLIGALAALVGLVLFRGPYSEFIVPTMFLACVGAIIGAIAGAAREIVGRNENVLDR